MMEQDPEPIDSIWMIRGIVLTLIGLSAAGALFFSVQPYYVIAALFGLGFGVWDLWSATSSAEDDRARRLTSPSRVKNAVDGLAGAGWGAKDPPNRNTG